MPKMTTNHTNKRWRQWNPFTFRVLVVREHIPTVAPLPHGAVRRSGAGASARTRDNHGARTRIDFSRDLAFRVVEVLAVALEGVVARLGVLFSCCEVMRCIHLDGLWGWGTDLR